MNGGGLIISLDFELNWGVHDTFRYGQYNKNLYGVRNALPRILALFERYHIHATWATVGLLFAESKAEMAHYLRGIPVKYEQMRYAAYTQLAKVGDNEQVDPLHFGKSLIEEIKRTPYQEIASHTFSHFYCLEKGQTAADFAADLYAMKIITDGYITPIKSITFPHHQINKDYFHACLKAGYICYRGPINHVLYNASQSRWQGAKQWLDSYINLTGHHIVTFEDIQKEPLLNIRASAFLRPYCSPLRVFERLKIKRIKEGMLEAAKAQAFYHLWWHPHNFGKHIDKNLAMLEELLCYFQELRNQYNFKSYSMHEVAALCLHSERGISNDL